MPLALHPYIDITNTTGAIRAQKDWTNTAAFRTDGLVALCALQERRIVLADHHQAIDLIDSRLGGFLDFPVLYNIIGVVLCFGVDAAVLITYRARSLADRASETTKW